MKNAAQLYAEIKKNKPASVLSQISRWLTRFLSRNWRVVTLACCLWPMAVFGNAHNTAEMYHESFTETQYIGSERPCFYARV